MRDKACEEILRVFGEHLTKADGYIWDLLTPFGGEGVRNI